MFRVKKNYLIAAAGVVLAVLICLLCIVKVPTGHTGVIVTFGKVENRTLDSGMHFKAPWQSVIRMDKHSNHKICLEHSNREGMSKETDCNFRRHDWYHLT